MKRPTWAPSRWIKGAKRRVTNLGAAKPVRMGQAMLTLLIRLVAVNLEVAWRDREGSTLQPRRSGVPQAADVVRTRDIAELLDLLRSDAGCADTPAKHVACEAARELGSRAGDLHAVLAALEETVTLTGRPECVKSAAAETLSLLPAADARRALSRMAAVAERRAEWDTRTKDDHMMLSRLVKLLAA